MVLMLMMTCLVVNVKTMNVDESCQWSSIRRTRKEDDVEQQRNRGNITDVNGHLSIRYICMSNRIDKGKKNKVTIDSRRTNDRAEVIFLSDDRRNFPFILFVKIFCDNLQDNLTKAN